LLAKSCQGHFIFWPSHGPPAEFGRDRRLDIAVVPRSAPALPGLDNVRACIEHTVTFGKHGFDHNKQHAYAKLNEFLKYPVNLAMIVVRIHGSCMALWYADRSGVIEVNMEKDHLLASRTIQGLSALSESSFCDPHCRLLSQGAYRVCQFTLGAEIYYGLYFDTGKPLYIADGITGRGTLVLPGLHASEYDANNPHKAFEEADQVAIKLSHPSIPWDIDVPLSENISDTVWKFEWQILKKLEADSVRDVPKLVHHYEHATTKSVRDACGLQDERYRVRAFTVVFPLADFTLQNVLDGNIDIEFPRLVRVMKESCQQKP